MVSAINLKHLIRVDAMKAGHRKASVRAEELRIVEATERLRVATEVQQSEARRGAVRSGASVRAEEPRLAEATER
jgi:hypothetical protein